MASLKDRISARITRLREERPAFDHVVRMVQHFGAVKGNLQAGAVTYYAFLSFFPILALAFFAVSYVAKVYPQADENLTEVLTSVLPGMIGTGDGQISLVAIQDSAATIGIAGVLGVLYAGLGWLSGMRNALLVMFEKPQDEQPNFVIGKLRDLISLIMIGVVLLLSVAVSSVITRFSGQVLDFIGLGIELAPLLQLISLAVGVAASTVLFFALFRLLADPHLPRRSMWSGALLGALGFEVLKQLSTLLMASTKSQPAFQAFGIALILVVWINYFSRVVMYAASWAHTSAQARKTREADQAAEEEPSDGDGTPQQSGSERVPDRSDEPSYDASLVASGGSSVAVADDRVATGTKAAFAAGGAAMLAVVAVLRRKNWD